MILAGDQAQLQAWKAWPSMAARVRLVPDKGWSGPAGKCSKPWRGYVK
jgi:vitamin B12 transport system substrate-binding protein